MDRIQMVVDMAVKDIDRVVMHTHDAVKEHNVLVTNSLVRLFSYLEAMSSQ